MDLDTGLIPARQAAQHVVDSTSPDDQSLSENDLTDIICFLLPCSEAASQQLSTISLHDPQHLVRRDVVDKVTFEHDLGKVETQMQSPANGDHAIALRFSAPVKRPSQGFAFGRNKTRCDICFSDPDKRLSNIHFRIYLDKDNSGALVLQDLSTNGTIVDGTLLGGKSGRDQTKMKPILTNGSKILVHMRDVPLDLEFLVLIPHREADHERTYRAKLIAYMEQLDVAVEGHVNISTVSTKEAQPLRSLVNTEKLPGKWPKPEVYEFISIISRGAFATLYKVRSRLDGIFYAAKELEKRRFSKGGQLDQKANNEINILQRIKHPHIVSYIEHLDWDDRLYIIMEHVPEGDLAKLISERGPLSEDTSREMSRQLIGALSYLHENNITHRDVKPDNILIRSLQPFYTKLTDFTLSTTTELSTFCGTLLYCAPEVYNEFSEYDENGRRHRRKGRQGAGQRYNQVIDIWSLGGVIYYTLTGRPPYPVVTGMSYAELLHSIMTENLDLQPLLKEGISADGIGFLVSALQRRPEHRGTARTLQDHHWLLRRKFVKPDNADENLDQKALHLSLQDIEHVPNVPDFDNEVDTWLESTHKIQPVLTAVPTDSGYASVLEMKRNDGDSRNRAMMDPVLEATELDVDDTATEYSIASSTTFPKQAGYITVLAKDLFHNVSSLAASQKMMSKISTLLPELLKAFALKVGHDSSTQMHRDVMAFVYKQRHAIATAFINISSERDEEDSERCASPPDGMDLADIMNLWESKTEFEKGSSPDAMGLQEHELGSASPDPTDAEERDVPERCEQVSESEALAYKEFLSNTEAYDWLLARLRRELRLVPAEPDALGTIRQNIISSLPSVQRVSTKTPPQSCGARFSLEWDILGFFKEQGYRSGAHEVFDGVITLTGSYRDAQATTCAQYIDQTWPSTGGVTVQLIKALLQNEEGSFHSSRLPDGTSLKAWFNSPYLTVEVSGVAVSVAEIGEQLAWLGAAMRNSPGQSGLVHCLPSITCTPQHSSHLGFPPPQTLVPEESAPTLNAEKRRNYSGYHRTSVACGHCRRRKIRCIPSPTDSQGRCVNCIRLKKECSFYPVDRQAPTDTQQESTGISRSLVGPKPALASYSPAILSGLPDNPGTIHLICKIAYKFEDAPQSLNPVNGQCWHDIFRNPVIVQGYPIPERVERNTGLEIPLSIMAGLARARRVEYFNGNVYIKGFSTLLVPTKLTEDILYWHLVYKKDGSRISYPDDAMNQEQGIRRLELEGLRHVLGWCSEAKFYAGSAEANYFVDHSRLPKTSKGCALFDTCVSPGRMILRAPAFHIGAKDTPAQVSRDGYIPRLKWLSTKYVLLWDDSDKRGWLINGTSALLHITRASLAYDGKDKFRSAFLYNANDLQESSEPFTADSAIDVLINPENLKLRLYPDKDGYILLESRIDQVYNIMEKLIDHQMHITGDCGSKIKAKPRRLLEGWDFEDLATNRDPLYPRVATLDAPGKCWVDFTRAIQAITLLGRGFGEIIRPTGAGFCTSWAELPEQKYYMATFISDLRNLEKQHGSLGDRHVRLCDNIIWHCPPKASGPCQCTGVTGQHQCEPVQTLVPAEISHILPPRRNQSLLELKSPGAVIFGQSSTFPWVWMDTGLPEHIDVAEKIWSMVATDVNTSSSKNSAVDSSLTTSGPETRVPSVFSSSRSKSSHSITSLSGVRTDVTKQGTVASTNRMIYERGQYKVGIICALPKELRAVRVLFDEKHETLETAPGDSNQYALGKMSGHMVVASCLPQGEYGTVSAAAVASNMQHSFKSIRFCLLVGIGGGVPSKRNDIRLGDVVVSMPIGRHPGVIQYDLGKERTGKPFEMTGALRRPPRVLTTAVSILSSDPDLQLNPLGPDLQEIARRMPPYEHPGLEQDIMFQTPCTACQSEGCPNKCCHLLQHPPRQTSEPVIHYGLIASGNRVIKDAVFRDQLAHEYDVLCFEMEAAGVLNIVDCLVIRGICDYCDEQKNDVWQEYAAATAAAYAKLLLSVVASVDDGSYGRLVERNSDEPVSKKQRV